MRAAYPGAPGYNPSYVSGPGNGYNSGSDPDRIANLKRAIGAIEQRLHSAPPVVPPYAHPQVQQHGLGTGAPLQPNSELSAIQAQLNQLSGQIGGQAPIGMPPHMGHSGEFGRQNSAVAEIANRQRMLNQHAAAVQAHTPPPAPKPEPAPKKDIIGPELAALKNELASLRKEVAKPVAVQQSVPQSEIDRIAHAIADLQAQNNPNEKAFDQLTREIDHLRSTMAKDVESAIQSHSRSQNNAEYGEIKSRFDELARNLDQVSIQTANQVGPRVEQLGAQLHSLQTIIDDLPQTLAITQLEKQLAEMASKMEQLSSSVAIQAQVQAQAGVPKVDLDLSSVESRLDEVARALPVSEIDLSSIENRLDEVARALVAVSNVGRSTPDVDLSALDRVEARMTELARSIDSVVEQDNGPQLDNLAVRIDGLTDRLGSFEKYAEAGDLGNANAMLASPDTGVIEDQLREISSRIEAATDQLQTDALEDQIAKLTTRMEEALSTKTSEGLSKTSTLEQQIASLSALVEEATNVNSANALSQPNSLEHKIALLSARIDEAAKSNSAVALSQTSSLEQQIATLSAMVEKATNSNSTLNQSQSNALEEQIAILSARVEEAANVNSAIVNSKTNTLEEQIAGLSARVEEAANVNSAIAQSQSHTLEAQIAGLSARLEEATNVNAAVAQSQTNTFEEQISLLSSQVQEAANVDASSAQMSNLEAQIGQIFHHLNNVDAGTTVDFTPVEARLSQIENQLLNTQNFSLEAAQQAAQQAVAMMGPQSESAQIIDALSQDLKSLQIAAESGNAQNAESVLHVQSTLQQVAERLGTIENTMEEVATRPATVIAAPSTPSRDAFVSNGEPAIQPSSVAAMENQTNEAAFAADSLMEAAPRHEQSGVNQQPADLMGEPGKMKVDAPSIDPTAHLNQASLYDNTPLEPGVAVGDVSSTANNVVGNLGQDKPEAESIDTGLVTV